MKKYHVLIRIFIVAPSICVMGFIWAFIGLFSVQRLGKVLKKTGENLME